MKIKRQKDLIETNKTTVFWLNDFAYELEKKAQQSDYLKEYLDKRNKKTFSSIEEKLFDIRNRVGLDLVKKVSNQIDLEHKDCATECTCNVKNASSHSESEIKTMSNILKYISDMINSEPHLDAAIVLYRCKHEEGLGYRNLENKIDRGKLIKFINDKLIEKNPAGQGELVSYSPLKIDDEINSADRIADYYSHSEPYRG